MDSVQEQYTKEIANHFGGYHAAWSPGTPLQLGDIGVVDGRSFRRVGNLRDELVDINFEIREDPTPEVLGPYRSEGKVSVSFKAAGAISPPNSQLAQADAGFSVQFAGEKAVFFLAEGCFQPSIADQIRLGRDVIAAYKEGRWDKNWHVITQIVQAQAITVFVSASSNGSVDLKVTAEVNQATGEADLAKVNLGLQTVFSKNMATTLVAQAGATPMFRLSRLRKKILGKPKWEVMKLKLGAAAAEGRDLAALPLDAITPALVKGSASLESYLAFDET